MAGKGSQPGERRGGRAKGTPNKATAALKDMILTALEGAHPHGSVGYLQQQSRDNPVAFMGLVGKVLPLQVNANHTGEVIGRVIWQPPSE